MKRTKKLTAVAAVAAVASSLLPTWIAASAQTDNTLFTEDFESYEVGTIIEATSDQSSSTRVGNIDYQLRTGDKLEIAEENGNKYLKITRASESSTNSHIKYYFPETYSDGTYTISYDFRPDVHNRYFARFGSFIRTSGINLTTISYGNDVYANNGTNASYYIGNLLKSANYTGSEYATITQTVDLTSASDNYTFNAVYPGSSGTVEKTVTNTANQLGITGLAWAIQKNTNNNYNGPDDASSAAVYRIDNIKVELVALNMVSSNVANNGEIEANTPFTMTFSEAVSEADITLKKNGAAMASGDYTVTVSGQTVSVMPATGWTDGSEYTVAVGEVTAVSGASPYSGTIFNLTGSSYLFVEDFENWTVGTISQANADQGSLTKTTNQRIGYQLKAGDKIAIAQDASGNKYLEITRASTNTAYSRYAYYFPQTYLDKKYTVSYNFMPEEHNQYFRHFGSLWKQNADGTQTGVIKQVTSYGKTIYYNADPSKNDIPDILNTAKYDGSAYATITQTVDFTDLSSSSLKGVLPDGTYKERTVGSSVAPQGVGFYGLLWDIQVNSSSAYNGGTDHTNPSVYRIDNIKVKSMPQNSQRYLSANIAEGATGVALNANAVLTFEETIMGDSTITVTENGSTLTKDTDYSVTVSEKTITIASLKDGWKPGATYTVSGTVSGKSASTPYSGTMLTFKTVTADTSAPSIIWSDIPNGAMHVSPALEEFTLRTDNQELDTVSAANITITKNGTAISGYTVTNEGKYAVKVSGLSLEKGAEYAVTVSGLKNKNGGAVQSSPYTMNFNVRNDIFVDAARYVITKNDNGGQSAKLKATLWNKKDSAQPYSIFGAMTDMNGRVISANIGSTGTISANGVADVEVSTDITGDAYKYTLFAWNGIESIEPLTEEILVDDPQITYGYDKYINNEPLRIAFLGGSITQQGQYTAPLKNYLNTILNASGRGGITYKDNTKSGVSGTGSELSIYRAEKDIISFKPDIVFIDCAVNDGYSESASDDRKAARKRNLENIIRQFMELPHQPMVIMLDFTTKSLGENRPVIDDTAELRAAYNIANVDVAQYIYNNIRTEENTGGTLAWTAADAAEYPGENLTVLTGDKVHPNSTGGGIYAGYMNTVLSADPGAFFKKMNTLETPLYASSYRNTRMVSWREGVYSGNWKYTSNGILNWHLTDGQVTPQGDDATVTFEFTGTTIGLYMATGNKDGLAGSMEYSIDGGDYNTVRTYADTSTWMANRRILGSDLDPAVVHTITLRAKDVDGKIFCFGYFTVD